MIEARRFEDDQDVGAPAVLALIGSSLNLAPAVLLGLALVVGGLVRLSGYPPGVTAMAAAAALLSAGLGIAGLAQLQHAPRAAAVSLALAAVAPHAYVRLFPVPALADALGLFALLAGVCLALAAGLALANARRSVSAP